MVSKKEQNYAALNKLIESDISVCSNKFDQAIKDISDLLKEFDPVEVLDPRNDK